jgi:solute:Na+ symporter, SSS family
LPKLHLLDTAVIAVYFALTVSVGLRLSRRSRDTEGYFLGGRSFPGWAIGLSLIGSMISSVTFIAYPADAFKTAWLRFLPNLAFPLVVALAAWRLVPFFRRGNVSSSYRYLLLRFGPSVSAYAAAVFLLGQMVRTATIMYLLAILLATLTGWSVAFSILLAGVITAVYTVKGGFTAVVWTDVFQTVILVAGGILCIAFIASSLPGGLDQIISEARAAGKLSFMDLNVANGRLEPIGGGFSLFEKTAPMLFFVGFFQFLTGQFDQTTVQRWCAARTPAEARKSMVILGLASLPIWGSFMFLGTCLWVYYRHFPSQAAERMLAGFSKAEGILPHYVTTVLPAGVAGVVIAAALSASMGALSSSINASAMVWVRDIYQPFIARGRGDRHYLNVGLAASLFVSATMMGGAWLFYVSAAKTLNEVGLIAIQLVGGGISGAFIIGMFTRIGDARAIVIGIAATALFTGYALLCQFRVFPGTFDPYYTSIIGNLIMMAVACGAALIWRAKARDLANLTVWDQADAPLE